MATYRGVVKDGVIVLEGGVRLPEGVIVEVRVIGWEEAFERVLRHRQQNAGYLVGMDEILAEDRKEREERYDEWTGNLSPNA
ncbi:MAG: hypothetical protein OXFUSZZB_002054 [Candidatus Fervidibacter sp.]|jgi:predicted DNA-binding antitoxin AbrB/MazE fold protein